MPFDFDIFKAFVLQSLLPDSLLESLRAQRLREPSYGYCNLMFRRFSNREADEIGLDNIIRQANEEEDIRTAVKRVSEYGFDINIGSYDEPSGRDLQVGVRMNEEAELTMRIMERLE
jgi:hypothetical protein